MYINMPGISQEAQKWRKQLQKGAGDGSNIWQWNDCSVGILVSNFVHCVSYILYLSITVICTCSSRIFKVHSVHIQWNCNLKVSLSIAIRVDHSNNSRVWSSMKLRNTIWCRNANGHYARTITNIVYGNITSSHKGNFHCITHLTLQ